MNIVWLEHQLSDEQRIGNWMFLAAFGLPSNRSDLVGDGEPSSAGGRPGQQWFDRGTGRAWVAMRA